MLWMRQAGNPIRSKRAMLPKKGELSESALDLIALVTQKI